MAVTILLQIQILFRTGLIQDEVDHPCAMYSDLTESYESLKETPNSIFRPKWDFSNPTHPYNAILGLFTTELKVIFSN